MCFTSSSKTVGFGLLGHKGLCGLGGEFGVVKELVSFSVSIGNSKVFGDKSTNKFDSTGL